VTLGERAWTRPAWVSGNPLADSRHDRCRPGDNAAVIFAFLSRRLRMWALLTVLLPLSGRLLETLGGRVGARNPSAGRALTKAGGYARRPSRAARRRF